MPPELAVVGSVNLDLVVRVGRFPQPGETLTGATLDRYPGGKGANQAVSAARLGAAVTLYGAVGTDDFAAEALAVLEEEPVNAVLARSGVTGVALILVDDNGENEIVVVPGANAEASAAPVGGAVLCQLEIPVQTAELAAEQADRFFLNAAPAREIPVSLVEQAEVVVVNTHELDALPATPEVTALTLGEEGAVLLERGNEVARATPPKVEAVDGTGAGDAFTACFVVSILQGRDQEEALRRACAAGAITASRPGAQPSLPTSDEVDAILA